MTREQAIQNAQLVESYLTWTQANSYITKETYPNGVNLHFFNPDKTEKEVKKIAQSLDTIRTAESDLRFFKNEKLGVLTFDVVWRIYVV